MYFSNSKERAKVLHIKPNVSNISLTKAIKSSKSNADQTCHIIERETTSSYVLIWHPKTEYCSFCIKEQEVIIGKNNN